MESPPQSPPQSPTQVDYSTLRRRRSLQQPLILSIPHEIIHEILLKAGEVPLYRFTEIKSVCNRFSEVMEEEWYQREIDLWEMELCDWPSPPVLEFKEMCLQLGNPSAMYLKGTTYLFREGMQEEGLSLIRQASEKGYDLAIYATACLKRIMNPNDQIDDGISRKFMIKARNKLIKDKTFSWNPQILQWFRDLKAFINVPSIKECKCIPNSEWDLPFKGPRACDKCFWKKETWCFAERYTTPHYRWNYSPF